MLIVLIYLVVFVIQFFSPLWFQILLIGINFIMPDSLPIADEIIQSIILANKISKVAKKGYSGAKIVKKIYNYKFKILSGIILIVIISTFVFLQKNNLHTNISNVENKNIFIEKDISKIKINKEKLLESNVAKEWIKENVMYDDKNEKYYFNDLQILELVEKVVIENGQEKYLDYFSKDELSLLRNIIFAKKGYIYKKGKYKEYFINKSWYNPVFSEESDIKITENEKKLIETIKKYENIK